MPVMVKYENDTLLNCQRMKSENNSDLRIVAALVRLICVHSFFQSADTSLNATSS